MGSVHNLQWMGKSAIVTGRVVGSRAAGGRAAPARRMTDGCKVTHGLPAQALYIRSPLTKKKTHSILGKAFFIFL